MSVHPGRVVEEARVVSRDLRSEGRGRILAAVAMGWFLSLGVRFAYPSLLPFLRDTFDLSLTLAGLLVTALWTAYALGQFPGGVIGDRFGEGNVLVVSTLVSTVALVVALTAANVLMLFVGSMAFGAASALYATARFTIFTDIYDERAGTAVGLTMAGGSVGNTVLPALTAAIATAYTWRLGLAVLVPFLLGITVTLWLVVPGRTSTAGPSGELSAAVVRRLLSSFRRDRIMVVVGTHVLLSFASTGFLAFYPTYLVEVKGFSPGLAATLYGLYFAVGVVLQPLAGLSNDRFGPKWTLATAAGLFSLGLFVVPLGGSLAFFVVLSVLLSNRNSVGVVTNTYIADSLPGEVKGSGLGLLRTSWLLVGAASPTFVGYLGDLGQIEDGYLVLAVAAGLATLLALLVPNR